MTAFPTAQQLADAVDRITESAQGGAYSLYVLRRNDAPVWFERARRGDREAARLVGVVLQVARMVDKGTPADPAQCATCQKPLIGVQFAIGAVLPVRIEANEGLGFTICTRCATTEANLVRKAVRAAERFWPGITPTPVHATGGRA